MKINIAEHQKVLKKLAELIGEEKACAAVIDSGNEAWPAELDEQIRKTGERFTVQIVGVFNSGKSSLINAMLGEELLPTGDLPETGVLSELVYGEEKSVTLYPRKGRWKTNEPFQIPADPNSISQYCSIDNKGLLEGDDDRATCCFAKMVITWPMELLRDGIILVDSVGLNDPWGNDDITRGYFPKADAMIYLLNCNLPYSDTDVQVLTEINTFSIRNIIFGATHFGELKARNRRTPEKIENFMQTIRAHCNRHSDLGPEAVHFLDSLDALDGKLGHNQELLMSSGLPGFEAYLSTYLVEDKGRDQVRNIAGVMRQKADQMRASAESQNRTGDMDRTLFDKIIKEQQERLTLAGLQKESASRGFRSKMETTYDKLDEMVEEFLAELPEKLDLEDFIPQTQFPTGVSALNPVASRRASKSFALEAQNELKKRSDRLMNEWISQTVMPYLQKEVENASASVKPEVDNFCTLLQLIDSSLTGNAAGTNASISQLAVAFASSGMFSALLMAIYGKEAAGRVLMADGLVLGATILLGILSAPLSIPAIVLATIAANILAVIGGSEDKKVAKAKASVLKDYRKALPKQLMTEDSLTKKAPAQTMKDALHGMVNSICDETDRLLEQDLNMVRNEIDKAIANYQLDKDSKIMEMEKRNTAIAELEEIIGKVEAITQNYGIEAKAADSL